MKKILSGLAAMFLFTLAVNAQTVDQIFSKYAKETGVEYVKIGKVGMIFAGLFGKTMGVDGVDVLNFGHCAPSVKEELNRMIHSFKAFEDPDYELLMTANDNGEHVSVLVKTKNDSIRELVVLTTKENDVTMIRIRGKIRPSDIKQFINN
ncbi:MAG: DUF4252 domain-containing protein [Tannerella sp.]|jgi:hypothetical protein|nr:DUF4252 domain-containing protein [Tannerella sp.]